MRALSTSSVRLCDKKNNVASSNQDDKTNADKVVDPTETSTSVEQKAEDDSKVIKMAGQNEEPVVSKTDNGSTTQSQMVVKTERLTATPKQVKANAAKSGKESLLDLLGAMKVEVTNKRKLKNLKFKQSYESMPTSKPAAMESTISMFQQATEEASSRRWEVGFNWEKLFIRLHCTVKVFTFSITLATTAQSLACACFLRYTLIFRRYLEPCYVFIYYYSLYALLFFSETLDPELIAAASAAASTLPNHSQAESELLRQLRQHEAVTEAQKKGDMNSLGYVS